MGSHSPSNQPALLTSSWRSVPACADGCGAAAEAARLVRGAATMVGLKPRGGFNRGFWSDRRNQSSLKPENALNRAARTLSDPYLPSDACVSQSLSHPPPSCLLGCEGLVAYTVLRCTYVCLCRFSSLMGHQMTDSCPIYGL